ncbi:hypothetical protein C8Q70DRAFT_1052308 [Cubamyces menziesii]|nr:hypothetical protein C8Q70DRAFT_1052308 [Cubamyces menziesii]
MTSPGDNVFDYIQSVLAGNANIPTPQHPCGEAWAPFQWPYANAGTRYHYGPAPMSYPVTFAAVNESVATPVRQPYYMAQERPSSHVAATNLSITPLVPPLVRPPTPTTLSTTYSSSTVPLSASSAQSHGPLSSAAHRVTASTYPPLVYGGNFLHQQRHRYPLGNRLRLRQPEVQLEPWEPVYHDDDRAHTAGVAYPLGSSSSNIPHSSCPATHAAAAAEELPASTTVRDRVGRVTRKRKNEGRENASNSTPVPSRKRRRLRDEHHVHGLTDDTLLDSSSGRGVMNRGHPVAPSMTDTGGYPLPHTDPELGFRTTALRSVDSSAPLAPYTYPPPLPFSYLSSESSTPLPAPQATSPRGGTVRPTARASFPSTPAPSVTSAVDIQENVDVVPSSEIAWDPSREVYPGANTHAARQARSYNRGRALRTEGSVSRTLSAQSPLRHVREDVAPKTRRRGAERLSLAEARISKVAAGFKKEANGTICPFVKCSKKFVNRSDCERHVRSLHLGIRTECRSCVAPRSRENTKDKGSFGRTDGFQRHLRETCLGKERLDKEVEAIMRAKNATKSAATQIVLQRYGRKKLPCQHSCEYEDGKQVLSMFNKPENWESMELDLRESGWQVVWDRPVNCCSAVTVEQPSARNAQRGSPVQEPARRTSPQSGTASDNSPQGANTLASPSQPGHHTTPRRIPVTPGRSLFLGEHAIARAHVSTHDQHGSDVDVGESNAQSDEDTATPDVAEAIIPILSLGPPVRPPGSSLVASPPPILEDGIWVNGVAHRAPAAVSPSTMGATRMPLGAIHANIQRGDDYGTETSPMGVVGDSGFDSSFDSMFDQCIAELRFAGANAGDMFRF